MRALIIAACLMMAGAAQAACPEGFSASEDNYGNEICRVINKPAASAVSCPAGMQAVDEGGRKVCKAVEAEIDFDPAKGCPAGTAQGTNAAGKNVCKRG